MLAENMDCRIPTTCRLHSGTCLYRPISERSSLGNSMPAGVISRMRVFSFSIRQTANTQYMHTHLFVHDWLGLHRSPFRIQPNTQGTQRQGKASPYCVSSLAGLESFPNPPQKVGHTHHLARRDVSSCSSMIGALL